MSFLRRSKKLRDLRRNRILATQLWFFGTCYAKLSLKSQNNKVMILKLPKFRSPRKEVGKTIVEPSENSKQ